MVLTLADEAQALDVLRDLVRIDTTNPPGNETACALYLRDLLAPHGIETELLESAPNRGNLIARLRGAGEGRPLLLMGHLDVVAANPAEWRYPPFAAEVHDGFVWGRGTTDMKQMLAVCAVVMMALSRLERPLKRDVLFVATADEEQGGRKGMGWLVGERPELFDVACALNEGGGNAMQVNGRVFYTCQSATKGVCRTVWTAESKGGHGAHPRADIATLKLSQALCRLGNGHLNERVIETMRVALLRIAAARCAKARERVEKLLDGGHTRKALEAAGFAPQELDRHWALFSDTVSVTGLRAGDPHHINVIPQVATAYADGRILPGQTRDGFIELLRSHIGDGVDIQLYRGQFSPGIEFAADHPVLNTIAQVISVHSPGAGVIPWQCAGSTDAKHLAPLGVPVYGFVPARPLPEGVEIAGAHASDERMWIENVTFALHVLHDVVYRFCSQL
ncbi:MAG: M20/M25/M40 family metallo-hydrolase [Chloroflexi bacterium]|nr:M20/M25/M40 family metallo-hydrolase [Chloroflexota bacterium]